MIRLVHLHIKKEAIHAFREVFNSHQKQISAFDGCQKLELWQIAGDEQRFITYSIWEDETALSRYRDSALFKYLWTTVKPLFESKAKAWSLQKI